MLQPATGAAWTISWFSMCPVLSLKGSLYQLLRCLYVCSAEDWERAVVVCRQSDITRTRSWRRWQNAVIGGIKNILGKEASCASVFTKHGAVFLQLSGVNLSCLRVAKRDSVAFLIKQNSHFQSYNTVIFITWQQRPSYYKLHLLVELSKKQAHGKENWKRAMKSKLFLLW